MRGALRHRTASPESRRQPVPATHRLTPGLPLRGRRSMTNPFQTVSKVNTFQIRSRNATKLQRVCGSWRPLRRCASVFE